MNAFTRLVGIGELIIAIFSVALVSAFAQEGGKPHDNHTSWICGTQLPPAPRISLHSPFPNTASRFWPNRQIPYEFDAGITAGQRNAMLDAMRVWEDAIGVDFAPRAQERGFVAITAHPQPRIGDYGPGVGYYGDGRTLRVGTNVWTRGVLLHELGHALGFWHTQSRLDRDEYVRIETNNIESGRAGNFAKEENTLSYGDYDFASIMHYGDDLFSDTNCVPSATNAFCRTITVLPPYAAEWQDKIGQRSELSEMDKLTMSLIYAPDNWKFVNQNSPRNPGNGTFFDPFRFFARAESEVPNGGTVIIQPGTYAVGEFHTKPITLRAPLGGVTLTK